MSEFLKEPEFLPEEDWKNSIDKLFEQKPKKVKGGAKHTDLKSLPDSEPNLEPTVRIQFPDPSPEMVSDSVVRYATSEIEHIRQAFLKFQEKISDLALYPHLFSYIEEFGYICQELNDLIEDNIDVTELTEEGRLDYDYMKRVRARILSNVWQRYNK